MGKKVHLEICKKCNNIAEIIKTPRYKNKTIPDSFIIKLVDLVRISNILMEAWSSKAIHNLLTDIMRLISRMQLELKTESHELKKLLREIQNKVKQEFNLPETTEYKNVICLGYLVKTVYKQYKGETDDWNDMKNRNRDMIDAIRSAYSKEKAIAHKKDYSNEKILKIFMAPEFFFRGENGAYDFDVVNGVKENERKKGKDGLLELLEKETNDPKYKDWLFVFGTAVCATKVTKTICEVCNSEVQFKVDKSTAKSRGFCKKDASHKIKEEVKGAMIDNVAIIKKGDTKYIVTKELIAPGDFQKDKKDKDVIKLRDEQLKIIKNKQSASNIPPKYQQDERMGGCIFTIDGITFGLEICLDHTNRRLINAPNVQIQLIPSAGMKIKHLDTIFNGIVFNVDGKSPHVQVVGKGKSSIQVHYDLLRKQLFFFNKLRQKDFSNISTWNATKNSIESFSNLTSKQLKKSTTPKKKCKNGSILLYGPYEIPNN